MIIKDKEINQAKSAMSKAGQKHELDVAFYLRRTFKNNEQVFVFNDLKITQDHETAQIDHLILYPFGFILIESKSITGEIKINPQEEWSRSYQGKWQGMSSPIKQVELQQKLLKELLFAHKSDIVGKILFKQQGFNGRCWDHICAVSSNAIIERNKMPKKISKQLVKAEFVCDKINEIMKIRNPILNTLNLLDTRPQFSKNELKSIVTFLKTKNISYTPRSTESNNTEITKAIRTIASIEDKVIPSQTKYSTVSGPKQHQIKIILFCGKCNSPDKLEYRSGRYGYFLKCHACNANTPLKRSCPSCKSKETKASKKRGQYTLSCLSCQESYYLEMPVQKII